MCDQYLYNGADLHDPALRLSRPRMVFPVPCLPDSSMKADDERVRARICVRWNHDFARPKRRAFSCPSGVRLPIQTIQCRTVHNGAVRELDIPLQDFAPRCRPGLPRPLTTLLSEISAPRLACRVAGRTGGAGVGARDSITPPAGRMPPGRSLRNPKRRSSRSARRLGPWHQSMPASQRRRALVRRVLP